MKKAKKFPALENNRDLTEYSVSFRRNLVGKTLGLEFSLINRLAYKILTE